MEKDTQLSTNRLFHYTPKKEYLIDILKNGFEPRLSLEKLLIFNDNKLLDLLSRELGIETPIKKLIDEFAIAMTCFCDIPLNLVSNHVKLYGNYSIGLNKEWAEKSGISPVFYIPEHAETKALFKLLINNYYKSFEKIEELRIEKIREIKTKEELLLIDILNFYNNLIELTLFIKPYKGFYERNNEIDYKFYDEREWRYVPNLMICKPYRNKTEYEEYCKQGKPNLNVPKLTFNHDEITDIVVPKEEVEVIQRIISETAELKDINASIVKSIIE